ncbi:MAG: glucosamine-6-phosphate deaminase [Caldilineaceae bacterium]|nr:glucosamine-6-phosphate deaminase [Caldilineaceae bacterium]
MSPSSLQRFTVDSVNVYLYTDKPTLSEAAADFVAAHLNGTLSERGEANLVLATGASQYDFLAALLHKDVDWSRITAFHLDEYIDLSPDHPASFRRFLRERFFNHVSMKAVHLLDGNAPDPQAEIGRYEALLRQHPVDMACIGIGENGHLAFNDPPADFETVANVHVVNLDEACRRQQVGEGHFPDLAAVPPQALSMTIPAILAARTISCIAPDARKAEAVRCALEGPITPDCPASALRRHADCHLYLDIGSAGLLSTRTTDRKM